MENMHKSAPESEKALALEESSSKCSGLSKNSSIRVLKQGIIAAVMVAMRMSSSRFSLVALGHHS
jgi:hypothetical protein